MEFVEIKQEKPFIEIKLENKSYILPVKEKEYITKLIKILKVDAELNYININEALKISGNKKRELGLCVDLVEVTRIIIEDSDPADLSF